MALTGKKPSELDTATINSLKTVLGINPNSDFKGLATTSTNPGTPEAPCYYLAAGSGTYTNFGGLAISGNLAFLSWNGSAWAKYDTSIAIDNFYNVTTAVPLTAGNYYSDVTARSAVPAGLRKLGLVVSYQSAVKEAWNLRCNAIPTSAGDITITLDDKSVTVSLDPAIESTPTLVISKIVAAGFDGWTITNQSTYSYMIYTKNVVGACYSGYFSIDVGTTGATFLLQRQVVGMDVQWKMQQFIGSDVSAWTTVNNWAVRSFFSVESRNQVDYSKRIIGMGYATNGSLNTSGSSWVFKVKDRSYLYCEYPLLYDSTRPLVCYYSYEDDFSDISDFIANATLVGTQLAFTGKMSIPEGADYAMVSYLDNNNFIAEYNYKFTILIDEDNLCNVPLGARHTKDNTLREVLDGKFDLRDNKCNDYGLTLWDRINGQDSSFMSNNGAYVAAADINKLDELVTPASENLRSYGVVNSLKLDTDTTITHSYTPYRRFQNATKLLRQFEHSKILVSGYQDVAYIAGFLVKYDGDAADLNTIGVAIASQTWNYSVSTNKIQEIVPLGDSVYKIIIKVMYLRIIDATFYSEKEHIISIQFEVPLGMAIEVGGFMLNHSTRENAERFFFGTPHVVSSIYRYQPLSAVADLLLEREGVTNLVSRSQYTASLHSRLRRLEYNDFDQANVVWLGTSVPNEPPFGEGGTLQYPLFVRDILHCNVTNKSIGGTKLITNIASGIYGLAMTQAEYDANPGAAGVERSYETQLLGLWDSDLFVFDHFHNDLSYLTALVGNTDYWDSDLGTYKITVANRFDRTWTVGAANYIIAEIYKRNPRAKIIFINDWRAENIYNKLACQVVADFWALPICNLRMGNANINLTTTQDIYLKPYNGGVNIKLLSGSTINPLLFQTKAAPDESATVPESEQEILYNGGADYIHPGRYGRIMYAKYVAKWMLNNVSLDRDVTDYFDYIT